MTRDAMPRIEKPPYGSPCNACGDCCRAVLCPLAFGIFGEPQDRTCPALIEQDDGTGACGMVRHPCRHAPMKTAIHGKAAMTEAALLLIGSGKGCDAQTTGEADNPAFRKRMRRQFNTPANQRRIERARRLWGV